MTRVADEVKESSEWDPAGRDVPGSSDSQAPPETHGAACERCGAPACVYIVAGYAEGKPVRQHLCHACADTAYELYLAGGAGHPRPRPRVSSLIIAAGLLLALLGASADLFGIQGSAGFGWKQQTGVAIGALLVMLGALLRVDALTVVGAILFGVAALADVYGTVGSPGLGWRQRVAILTGLAFVLAGLYLRNRRSSRRLPGTD